MDTAQWPQEIVVKPIEEIIVTNTTPPQKPCITSSSSESCKKANPQKEVQQQIINCPRRYWTEGGSLRNIPVGGGSRKNNKRSLNSSPSQSNSSASSKKIVIPSADQDHGHLVAVPVSNTCPNPNKISNAYDHHQDLNLGYSHESSDFKALSQLIQVPNFDNIGSTMANAYSASSPTNSTTTHHLSAMELLTGIQSTRGLGNSFMPMLSNMSSDNNIPTSNTFLGFPLNSDQYHQFMKPVSGLGFSLDNELEIGNNNDSTGTGRHLFPFEDLKLQAPGNATNIDHTSDDHRVNDKDDGGDEQSNGFWNGMLGSGGGSW
ncbi:DOF domain class transcription factor [Heracleum sosnowskyi]|uniref:DOF domain class transcription factor n=1 Tax=Heracleum sosnowskyi TaxID=360622 RepID=A0AAD8IBA0_9APIA|nr:DOF domain class transcription factor [Heracleum sosnowskyi]